MIQEHNDKKLICKKTRINGSGGPTTFPGYTAA